MKKIILLIIICISAFGSYNAMAQCNSTFTYVQQGSFNYKFTSNQVEQQGYTYNYTWDFGNGGMYYTPSVVEYFYSQGTYQVCLTVSIQDSLGAQICTDSTCLTVTALAVSQCFPNLYFSAYQVSGTDQVNFNTNITDYTNVTIAWDFGDGTQATGVAAPVHNYPALGTYTVCVYVVDTATHCGDTVCNAVTLTNCQSYNFISYYQPVDGTDSIYFYTNGTPNVWTFGDGSPGFTSYGDTTYVFPGPGEYEVCVTTGSGACQVTTCDSVIVDNCTQAVNFQYDYVSDSLFQVVFFTNNDLNNVNYSSFYWNFGDGTVDSTDGYVTHDYPGFGTYIACFSAYVNGCGLIQQCDTIVIQCNLASTFVGNQLSSNTIEYVLDTVQAYPGEVYHWTFGDSATDNTTYPVHVYSQPGIYNACLTVTDSLYGCAASSYCTNVNPTIWDDTICGHAWVDENMNGIQDSTEPNYQSAAIYIYVNGGVSIQVFTDSNGNYTAVVPSNEFFNIYSSFINNAVVTMPAWGGGYFYSFYQDSTRQCGFDFGIATNKGTILGYVYDDLNLDGIFDNNDIVIPNQVIDVNGQPAGVSSASDGYRILEPAGSYTLSVDTNSYYYNQFPILPASLQATLATPGSQSSPNNFAIDVPTTYNDLGIDIIPGNPLLPGWYAYYQVLVTNYGPNTESNVDYSFNTPAPLIQDIDNGATVTGNSLGWTSGNIYPFNGTLSQPIYTVDPSTPINTDVYDTANLVNYPDANSSNNSDTCHQITVSSYDPNNKISTQSGNGPTGLIPRNQVLKYVINFQNTGTSPAINVVVRDVLDANLDFSTFRYVGSGLGEPNIMISHDTLYFRFSNIQLEDSSQSQVYSTSWVSFSIKPKSSVTGGAQIHNNADIFFDYNTPVRTNTTLHTIEGEASVPNICCGDGQLFIAPNPFGPQTSILLQNMPGDRYNYQVTDVLGRQVTQGVIHNNQTITLYRGTMSAGTYIISFYDDNGIVKRAKLVVQ